MTGNFLVSGGSYGGGFVATFRNHKIGGNFTIDVTAPNIATYDEGASLEFNGTAQTYLNRGMLNNVIMNQTGVGTLTLQNHGGASAWMTLSDSGSLTLNYGKIITGTNRIEVRNRSFNAVSPGNIDSYIQGNSGVLNSCLQRYLDQTGTAIGTYEFPIGTSTRGYEHMSLEFTSPLPVGVNYVYANFNDNTPANNTGIGTECSVVYNGVPATPLDNGYWQLQPFPVSQFSSGAYTPHLYNRSYTNAMAGWTVMVNKANPATAINWFLDPPAAAISCALVVPVTDVYRPGANVSATMQNTSVLYLGTAQSIYPLPVELILFEAHPKKDLISLKWITASEENNLGFELQRAIDPSQYFEKIGFVSGNGSTSESHNYSFDDFDVIFNKNYYYRLKQMDINGNIQYSKVVSASLSMENFFFYIFSEPFSETTNLAYSLNEKSNVTIEIFTIMGQKIGLIFKGDQEKGDHVLNINSPQSKIADGIYMIKMTVNDEVQTKRAVILN